MAKSLTVKNEKMFGRQPEQYMFQLINDALDDIASHKRNYTKTNTVTLVDKDRWYALDDEIIDIVKVEILDTNSRYIKIPKLADPQNLLRGDEDATTDTLT